ncbi:uncharacterized protein VNE69_12004 [Vairimorpha necatrix]|uniref:Uncharacterized protein n=1 Tax=Vairimorpha necatrix TaxID=6039 RepID=A0AAX4JGD2_9MICR
MILIYCLINCSEYFAITDEDVKDIILLNSIVHEDKLINNHEFLGLQEKYVLMTRSEEENLEKLSPNKENFISFDENTHKSYHILQNLDFKYSNPAPIGTTSETYGASSRTVHYLEDKGNENGKDLQKRNINKLCSTSKPETSLGSCHLKANLKYTEEDLSKANKTDDFNNNTPPVKNVSSHIKTHKVKKQKPSKVPLLTILSRKCHRQLKRNKQKLDIVNNLNASVIVNLPKFNNKTKEEYEKNRLFVKKMFVHLNHSVKRHFSKIFKAIEEEELPSSFKINFIKIRDFFTYIIAGLEERGKKNLAYNMHAHMIIKKNKFWIEILTLFAKTSFISILNLLNNELTNFYDDVEDIVYHFGEITKKFTVIDRRRDKYIKSFKNMNKCLSDLLKFNA